MAKMKNSNGNGMAISDGLFSWSLFNSYEDRQGHQSQYFEE
jgi:hypothetical protein